MIQFVTHTSGLGHTSVCRIICRCVLYNKMIEFVRDDKVRDTQEKAGSFANVHCM